MYLISIKFLEDLTSKYQPPINISRLSLLTISSSVFLHRLFHRYSCNIQRTINIQDHYMAQRLITSFKLSVSSFSAHLSISFLTMRLLPCPRFDLESLSDVVDSNNNETETNSSQSKSTVDPHF